MRINSGTIFRCVILISLTLPAGSGGALCQDWSRVEVFDPQLERPFAEFTLPGKFIETRYAANSTVPLLILRCQQGRYASGHVRGKLLAAVLHIGGIQDGALVRTESHEDVFAAKPDADGFYVEYAYDGGTTQSDHWDNLLDYRAVGFGRQELNGILWGTTEPHQEEANPPVKKFVMTIQPPLAGRIVMQFDLPDPAVVSELCGCTYFKKKK